MSYSCEYMSILTVSFSLSDGTQLRIINSYAAMNHDIYFFICTSWYMLRNYAVIKKKHGYCDLPENCGMQKMLRSRDVANYKHIWRYLIFEIIEKQLEQLEGLRSEDTPTASWLPIPLSHIGSKSKEDKVKVTNLKNSPQLPIFEFRNGHYTRHTFWSCLLRCANMK